MATSRILGTATRPVAGASPSSRSDRLLTGDCQLQSGAGQEGGAATGSSPVDCRLPGFKYHLLIDATGLPLACLLTGGDSNDVAQSPALLDAMRRLRGRVARPLRRPRRLLADWGYDHDNYRRRLRARGITPQIPQIARRGTPHGSGLGARRWVVERSFAWLLDFRRLLARHERRTDMREAFLSLACCPICFRRLRVSS